MSSINLIHEFPHLDSILYLNHAAVAPWPRRSSEAVKRFADENLESGAAGYARWQALEDELRGQLQTLVTASSRDDIALLKNTSEALSVVAQGLEWRSGDNVVCARQEFPSNRIVWQALARDGVDVRLADLDSADPPEDALLALTDRHTRLLAVSSVQYANGLRMDLERLGQYCRDHSILLCVDAIQSLGAEPFDAGASGADFVMADGHKWMLGPEGLAVFYSTPEARDRLRLRQFGWHMVEDSSNFERLDWVPTASARRFECGSPNLLGAHALHASLSLLLEIGLSEVASALRANTSYLIDLIDSHNILRCLSPRSPERRLGIVTFTREGTDPAILHRHLKRAGVICAARGGGIRFSPHFYTPRSVLERAVDIATQQQLNV